MDSCPELVPVEGTENVSFFSGYFIRGAFPDRVLLMGKRACLGYGKIVLVIQVG